MGNFLGSHECTDSLRGTYCCKLYNYARILLRCALPLTLLGLKSFIAKVTANQALQNANFQVSSSTLSQQTAILAFPRQHRFCHRQLSQSLKTMGKSSLGHSLQYAKSAGCTR